MKIRSVGSEFFHVDGHGHDKVNSRLSPFFESAKKQTTYAKGA